MFYYAAISLFYFFWREERCLGDCDTLQQTLTNKEVFPTHTHTQRKKENTIRKYRKHKF